MTVAAPVGPLTERDLNQLVAELPARQRADLAWTLPAVRAAVRALVENELSDALVIESTEAYFKAIKNVMDAVMNVAATEPAAFGLALQTRLTELGPRILKYFGDTPHAVRITRAVVTMFVFGALGLHELSKARSAPNWAATLQAIKNASVDAGSPDGGFLRATVLCAAVLDAMERDVAPERVLALVDRADNEASWPLAWLLANTELIPGAGRIKIPSYFPAEQAPVTEPHFKTELARDLWEQRQKIQREGHQQLDVDAVEAEVARRRGGTQAAK